MKPLITVLVGALLLAPPAASLRAVEPITAFKPNARILFQGDSITDGNRGRNADPNHILGHGYAFIIAARHGAMFPEAKLDFINRGVSGNTVLDLEKRWQKDTLDVKPDVLSILIGVNDNSRGVALDQYEQVYDQLITDAKTANPKLKLVLGEPFVKPTGKINEGIRNRQEIVARLAQKHGAALVRYQRVFDEAVQRAPADYWVWDNVHPTYRGHQLMADEWERTVRAFWPAKSTSPPASASARLLPPGWNAKHAADQVLERLVKVTASQVKGAHDAEMALVGDRAFIVAEVNDEKASESADWPFIYAAMSIVNLKTLAVEKVIPFAKSAQVFENGTLPTGACFVPRILQKDNQTLRCYFASEEPKKRQAQTWFIDFDLRRMAFEKRIHRAKLKTAAGTFDMQPRHFYADAVKNGFTRPAQDFGLYLFDSFKVFDGRTYVALNNYPGGQNALAVVNPQCDTFEVLGHYNEPGALKLTESAVNRLPDGTWMAICRQEGGTRNYTFCTSQDGRHWTPNQHRDCVPSGTSSKPTFDRFKGVYYLGWQDAAKVKDVNRSVFNLEVSTDGRSWERKYCFETGKSFQYPTFREHRGTIYLTVTQGDFDPSRKERIMFGKLE